MTRIRLVFFLLLATAFTGCGEKPFFEENKEIADNSWGWNEPVEFKVEVQDTLNAYNFFLNMRITKSYEYSNIYVFVNLDFPNGKQSRDTIHAPIADDFGNWLGKPSGSLVNNKILFGIRRIFPVAGTYTFTLEQGMRDEELAEVADIGLRIEKAKR